MPLTLQSIEVDSKDGRTFLRKVQKQGGWRVYAGDRTEWKVQFRKTINGDVGEPDEEIEVMTDLHIGRSGKFGMSQSFGDSKPVMVCTPYAIHLDHEVLIFAKLALDGWRFTVEACSGSTSSSEFGLAFYRLTARHTDCGYSTITLGGQSVSKDGRCICSSAVSI